MRSLAVGPDRAVDRSSAAPLEAAHLYACHEALGRYRFWHFSDPHAMSFRRRLCGVNRTYLGQLVCFRT